jgi:proline dehydrogenase
MSIFNDTKIAFANKSTAQLKKAYWLFKSMEIPQLTSVGISLLNFTVKNNFPFVKTIVRNTLFEQFCGGETREESSVVVQTMYSHHIGSIFDYSVEGVEAEGSFDSTCEEIRQNVLFSADNPAVPFVVFKPTGFGRLELYTKISEGVDLNSDEKDEWNRILHRYSVVCELAESKDVLLLVDAEESWIQEAVDGILQNLMQIYNTEKPRIWNTVQMYRTGRIDYLKEKVAHAKENNYYLGYKMVRGAYMEKERERAEEKNYPSPIQDDKEATDKHYNDGIVFIFNNLDRISGYFGTHNEDSTALILNQMKEKNLENDYHQIHFGQLYGMSDNITYKLGSENYNASKYLPYGSIADVVPYLTRRAKENTSIKGQTGRELSLIESELKRRNKEK